MCPEIKSKPCLETGSSRENCIAFLFVPTGLLCEDITFVWNQVHCWGCFFMKYTMEAS